MRVSIRRSIGDEMEDRDQLRSTATEAAQDPHRFHRCESPLELVAAAESIPFFGVPWKLLPSHRDWAVALVLAGAPEPLELNTPQTGVRNALTHIFAGTGSSIRTQSLHCESIR